MGGVTPIREEPEYVAYCPECRNSMWLIRLDSIKDDWENIIGTECAYCGFSVDWVLAKKTTNESH